MKAKEKPLTRKISIQADGKLLLEGALLNIELQKKRPLVRFPKGVFHYKTNEEADEHMKAFETQPEKRKNST